MADDGTVTWRELRDEAQRRLGAAEVASPEAEARWIVEEASGWEGADHHAHLDDPATERGVVRFDAMVARRLDGEPLQYVLGRWSFRTLDLAVDRRALIPRPETEGVVDHVLAELDRLAAAAPPGTGDDGPLVVVDLGTGTGAIALSVAAERAGVEVWATDVAVDTLALARANLAGLGGRAATRVRLADGDWYAALPDGLRGRVAVVVSNPPYVAEDDEVDPVVGEWEPAHALVPGPTGLEAIERIIAEAPAWLAPGGALVVEIGAAQGPAVLGLAAAAGLVGARVEADLAGRDRCLVARRPG